MTTIRHHITIIAAMLALAFTMGACKTLNNSTKQTTTTSTGATTQVTTPQTPEQQLTAIVATLGNWQTLQCGGSMKLSGGKSLSSSMQMRMVRDDAIYISVRPALGIEVARLLITADSVYAVDKVHRRYLAEKVSLLTAGVPVTVSTVQDIFLGRAFVIGQGTLGSGDTRKQVAVTQAGNGCKVTPEQHYKGYGYSFTYDAANRIVSLDIIPEGSTKAAYQVGYDDVKATTAGHIAHSVTVNASVSGQSFALDLNYGDIQWNQSVKIDRSIPSSYKRISASSLASLLGD